MRILLTNDDGIDMDGLHVLARAMKNHGEVVVAAPEAEQSGMGAAFGPLHLLQPEIHRRSIEGIDEAWAVNGTPGLCVFLARLGVFGEIDMVVSGINPGANVGRAVYHSGTVGAALTARGGQMTGVAVSQATPDADPLGQGLAGAEQMWDTAAAAADVVVGALIAEPPESALAVNVNVPNCRVDELTGWRQAAVGEIPPRTVGSATREPVAHRPDRFKITFEWGDKVDLPIDVDGGAVNAGEVSVSVLTKLADGDPLSPSVVSGLDKLVG